MNKYLKIILILAGIGILAALYVWFFIYNKPHRDYASAEPDQFIAAEQLFYQYRNDKALSDSLYTGMVVQVNGPLMKVESMDSTAVVIFAFEQGMFGDEGVRCIMIPGLHISLKDFNIGDEIHIKGFCTGYNDTDVIIEKASIVTND